MPVKIPPCPFWHFLIRAKLSDLWRFRPDWYCTHYARINCKQTKPVLVREWMPALNPNNNPMYTFTRAGHLFFVGSCDARTLLGTIIWLFIPASVHFLLSNVLCLWLQGLTLYTCTRTNPRVTYSGQTCGWSENTLILTNESTGNITCMNRFDQSQLLAKTDTHTHTQNTALCI